jgi:hypothetical protein
MDAGDVPKKVNGRGAHVRPGTGAAPVGPRSFGREHDRPLGSAKKQGSADLLPGVTLPKGGGAIHGHGREILGQRRNRSGNLSIPLPFSPGRFTPRLQLASDPRIARKPGRFAGRITMTIVKEWASPAQKQRDEADASSFVRSKLQLLAPLGLLQNRSHGRCSSHCSSEARGTQLRLTYYWVCNVSHMGSTFDPERIK